MKYIFFDLDGTLCESKQPIDLHLLRDLEILNGHYRVIIISGAEYSRMLVQAPIAYVTYMAQNGNEVYENGNLLWKNIFMEKPKVEQHYSQCAYELGIQIEDDMVDDRGCQISFSFIGHNAPKEIKALFDPKREIRMELLKKYPFDHAVIGGTTCIDYIPYTKGENIREYLKLHKIKSCECLYIGDAFMPYGNDTTVVGVIPTFQVRSPLETQKFINQYDCRKIGGQVAFRNTKR